MITAIRPQVNPLGRYSVTETSRMLGICTNSLRKYTEQGLLKFGIRKATGRKFYVGKEIIKFWEYYN